MNNIEELSPKDIKRLLAAAEQYEERGSIVAGMVKRLIAQLEAAQKELFDLHNQEFQQRLANAEHQLYMKDLAIHNIKASRMAQFRKRLKAEAELSAANEKLSRHIVVRSKSGAVAYRYKLKNDFCRWAYSDGIPPNKPDKFQEELLFTHPIRASIELPDVELGKYWFEHDGRNIFDGVEFNNDVISAIKAAGFTVEGDITPIVIEPAPAESLKRCAAARDGECHHAECPQLRDNEPKATGRHCPIDNWDDE